MKPEFQRVKELFLAALEKEEPAAREAFLAEACGADVPLRQQVDALLGKHEEAGGFLVATVDSAPGVEGATGPGRAGSPRDDATPLEEAVGTRIGPYKLLQKLGEGGMGAVWAAEQTEPVKRRVALKLIKAGMDSTQVLRRFEAERQALALMDHTNIAKVFDAGRTPEGRPYFVMELVKGVPITKYCDELHLPLRERLELFVPVCQAIQHAHQKGIIHRDIKPSNVLICMQDGKPMAKVIDFGIAKALHQSLTDSSMYTEIGQIVGTLEYMSPEQAELSALDIDTRADVYSLGALLYELLTGSTPLDRKRLKNAAMLEMLRMIREDEPQKPSTRLTESKESLPSLAAQRRTNPGRLAKDVRGELDWIVMKALEKDRTRRYETANGFARDVQRHLADEPVEACPPSKTYRLRKLLRRHRGPVLAGGVVLLALVAGVVGTTAGMVRAERAREQADESREEALRRLTQIDKGTDILGSIFKGLDPDAEEKEGKPLRRILADRLKLAAKQLDGEGIGDPLTVAKLQYILGQSLLSTGEAAEAIQVLEKSAATHATKLGDDHLSTLRSRGDLASAYHAAGKHDLAIPLFERTLKAKVAKLGDDHPDTLLSRNNLANGYQAAGKLDLAILLFERTLKANEAKLGDDHPHTLSSRNNLAGAYLAAGKLDLAIPLFERTLKANEAKQGDDHPLTLLSRNGLAVAYQAAGKLDLAIPLHERTLKAFEAKLGDHHPHTLSSRHSLAVAYQDAGKRDLAIPLQELTLKARVAKLGDDHPHTLLSRGDLAASYWENKQLDRSVPLFEDLLRRLRAKSGDDHPDTFVAAFNLGANYRDAGRMKEAVAVFDEWLPRAVARLKPGEGLLSFGRQVTAITDTRAGRHDQAIALLTEDVAAFRKQVKPDDPRLAGSLVLLGHALLQADKPADAEPILRECLTIYEKQQPDDVRTFLTRSRLGAALLGQKKYADAEPLLLQGYEGMKKREAKIVPIHKVRLTEALEALVRLNDATGKKDEAAKWRKELEASTKAAGAQGSK